MRRHTLTPARSRLSVNNTPSTNKGSNQSSIRLNSIRNVRDPDYFNECVQIVNNYLSDSQISLLSSACPSYKNFKQIFIHLLKYFSPQAKYDNFTEEAHSIIRSLKYPYSNELNKSHLITTNPHSWPVILSFLRWVVEMIEVCSINENIFSTDFTDGYRKFMEGHDNYLEEIVRSKNENDKNSIRNEISKLKETKLALESQISELSLSDLSILKNKLSDLKADKYSIENNFKPLESKETKHRISIEQIENEIKSLPLEQLLEQKNEILIKLNDQKEKIQNYNEQCEKKNELITDLENIKKEKKNLFDVLKEIDSNLTENQEKLKILKNQYNRLVRTDSDTFLSSIQINEDANSVCGLSTLGEQDEIFKDGNSILPDQMKSKNYLNIDHLNGIITQLEDKLAFANESFNENENSLKNYKTDHQNKNKRIVTLSQHYLEKKELFELNSNRSINEMGKLENELLSLKTDTGNSLLQSERDLQLKNIKKEKIESDISMEEAQINLIVSKFYNEMIVELENVEDVINH